MTEQEERERARENARLVEFVHLYSQLSDWQKVRINTAMSWLLFLTAIERRDMRLLWNAILLFVRTWGEFLRRYLPGVVLALAAAICWAWALATGAGVLFVAAAALGGALFLKVRPWLQAGGSDEIE